MKSALFRDITRRCVVIGYRRFGTTYRSHLNRWPLKTGPIRCPATSVNNYYTTPRNITEESRSILCLFTDAVSEIDKRIRTASETMWKETVSGLIWKLFFDLRGEFDENHENCYWWLLVAGSSFERRPLEYSAGVLPSWAGLLAKLVERCPQRLKCIRCVLTRH
jgi:hypothetical protein